MNENLGHTRLRRKRRNRDQMAAFDRLPAPLRGWLAEAVLPWSPCSAHRLWGRCLAKGLTPAEALAAMSQAEQKTLARHSGPSGLA